MRFSIRLYDADGNKPVLSFLERLQKQNRILQKLVVAGIKKLETSERHGPPLTQLVDQKYNIFELRIGNRQIVRIFFFFRQNREIILTNGYVKKKQKIQRGELQRARTYKSVWEQQHT